MKNFLRSLRHSWKYRKRLLLSIACALVAAALWGLNFTAIYPILKILGSDHLTMQEWIDAKVEAVSKEIEVRSAELAAHRDKLKRVEETWPEGPTRDREIHKFAGDVAKIESKLDSASTRLWRYQQVKNYFIRFLPSDRFLTLAWLLGMVVLGVALKGFFEFWQEWLVGSVMNRTLADVRNRFYRNAVHQDMRQFGEQGTHELMARFTNDTEILGAGIKVLYGKVIAEPLRALACVAIACWISWQLTVLFLVLVPLALLVLTKVSRLMKRATRRVLERMSNIYKILQETFRGIRVVKAFTMEPYERRRFHQATRDYCDKAMRVVTIDALASPIVELLGIAAVSLALLAGAYLVLNGQTHLFGLRMMSGKMDFETLLQLFALLAATADPVRKLSSVYTKLQSGAAAADRIFSYLDKVPEVRPNSDGPRLERHAKEIEFRDVCFSYEPGTPVLTNSSLKVGAGETVAVVGPNGCGKSTLLNLLPRFFDPDHGSIFIDGIDIRKANLRSLRKQIGIVTQDAVLFDDTIAANIAYGNRRATREQIEEAARKAFAHDFIVRDLPRGYDTLAGEAGVNKLSGGQKQRLALARAILRDPSILILDEFTSQWDPESVSLIHEALREFVKGRTTFIITHQLHTLEIADRIVVMDDKRIAAVGTHAELLATCPLYQRLSEAQFQRRVA